MTVPPAKKLEDLIHLAELCVDLLQQNEEHYAEVNFIFYPSLIFDVIRSICLPLIFPPSLEFDSIFFNKKSLFLTKENKYRKNPATCRLQMENF